MTVTKRRKPHDGLICGAAKRQGGGRCTQAAGWGTDHPGQGRCKLHGGATPVRHGRYSAVQREPLRLLQETFEADPDPLNLLPDLALARANLVDFLNRFGQFRDALLGWYESWNLSRRPWTVEQVDALRGIVDDFEDAVRSATADVTERQEESLALARELLEAISRSQVEGRPRQVLDISAVAPMIDGVSKIVERIERIRAANAISRPDLLRVMAEMGRVVEAHVKDDVARQRITEGWLAIRVA